MKKIIRSKTHDASFQFRMGAGFPGDVNRTHPVTIEPCQIAAATPPTGYGQAVLLAAANAGVRPFAAGDAAVAAAFGITVRPYPFQQSSASNFGSAAFGAATPPVVGAIDVLRSGYIMVKVPAGQVPVKGDPVYVWVGASAGLHVLAGFEATDAGADTTPAIAGAIFNGTPDADGNVEVAFNI